MCIGLDLDLRSEKAQQVLAGDQPPLGILATDLSLAIENHVLGRQATKLQALASKDELTGVHNRR